MGIIEFKDVSFQYPNGFSAVENVSFEINEGEAIAIIGQNGAGKTTTVKMINGLLKPTHGTVLIDGMDTKDYTTAQLSKIAGYVFQNPDDQIFHNNVEDEIRFGPKKQGLSEEEIVKKTEWAAKLCGLSEQMQENPYNLPLSIRKFVSIASVLAMDDKILILDEPTAGLDVIARDELLELLREFMEKDEDRAILISSHISSDLETLCDDLYMIHDGKIILHEDTDVLLGDYALLKLDDTQYHALDKQYLLRSKKEPFGYSCLTDQKQYYIENYPDITIEKGIIDAVITMMIRGE